ncbi:MAG: peptide chain release factor N(5)-glutamine methyltransferase [Chloroflexi bacterium HGW-Chloroflexi-10]|nr:MAG: peptide chain release factor N(5)-glutamine methyltransferase [Chloroflexi bacterium HGW-Chloroflexi-10]
MIRLSDWRNNQIQTLTSITDEAEIVVSAILKNYYQKNMAWILANPGFLITEKDVEVLTGFINKLSANVPLPYVLGKTEFYGEEFLVSPAVLIPRPETELLVDEALHWAKKRERRLSVVDVGVGSGCILISLLKNHSFRLGLGIDRSFLALRVAKQNALRHDVEYCLFLCSDLVTPLWAKFDLVCANLPYIPSAVAKELPVARYEPILALDGGNDGIELIRRLVKQVKNILNPSGLLLLEIQFDQAEILVNWIPSMLDCRTIRVIKDYQGLDRFIFVEV